MIKPISGMMTRQRRLLHAQKRINWMYMLRGEDIVALSDEHPVRFIAELYHMTRQRVEQIIKAAKK